MATFVPVTDCAQFQLKFTQSNGDFAENTFWVKDTAHWTAATINATAETLIDWWQTGDGAGHSLKALATTGTSLTGVTGRDFTTQNSAVGGSVESLPDAGTDGSGEISKGVTFAVTAKTGIAGRSFRGRMYMVGLPADAFSSGPGNVISGSYAGNLILAMNSLDTTLTAAVGTQTLVVVSRRANNAPRVSGVATHVTGWGFADLFMDFQRRRAPAHNRHH